MRDGFDSNVAKRMPTKNGARPNRPWNVDPVQLKTQEEELVATAAPAAEPVGASEPEIVNAAPAVIEAVLAAEVIAETAAEPEVQTVAAQPAVEGAAEALSTLEEINSEFSNLLFERKDIQNRLRQQQQSIEALTQENARLQASLEEMQSKAVDGRRVNQEIIFLNEQLQDAEAYIQNLSSVLDERNQSLADESRQRAELQERLGRITAEVQSKAKLDVKVMILERDLKTATGRVSQLENELEAEYRKRAPLEAEIGELKSALDKVHSSLAQIRLKAKREVYGS
ncbi:MAG: Chromosome partition protein Smc [Deltaproteobacteria bacterium ADurb.Bin510]|nr:MAG: Chromosome partition protein Smc [Deltaproteobacteria bacterium ADurb.Bin510]